MINIQPRFVDLNVSYRCNFIEVTGGVLIQASRY